MSISNEFEKLAEQHRSGVLSSDEFSRAKARVLDAAAHSGNATGATGAPAVLALNSLRRSRSDRWLGGVCGGLTAITGLASWVWRLLFVAAALFAGGGVLLYGLLWMLLPDEAATNPRSGVAGPSAST